MVNLNNLVPISTYDLGSVHAINDAGQIVGVATYQGRWRRAVLLTPVPEPATAALCGVALVGLALMRQFGKSKSSS
jgi:hypothetical protein